MKIMTKEQAVLELLLKHWESPLLMDYTATMKKIRELWPVTERSMSLDWKFHLTAGSLIDLSKRYLGKDLKMDYDQYTLLVDSTDLSLQILSQEEFMADFPRRMDRMYLGL